MSELGFYPFGSIESFMRVYKHVQKFAARMIHIQPVYYYPMTKLHGTNAGVVISEHGISAQKRSGKITPERDNADFAKFVSANADFFRQFAIPGRVSVLFGEWCGPGIQRGVAISKLTRKIFAPFMYISDVEMTHLPFEVVCDHRKFACPERNIYPIPLDDHATFMINFFNEESVRNAQANIEYRIGIIEKVCPFTKANFGIEGDGEGAVYYPFTKDGFLHRSLIFKAKGEKHREKAVKSTAEIDPVVYSKTLEFAQAFCTPIRLDQGLSEIFGSDPLDIKKTGEYIAWVNRDVLKESVEEFNASGLDWKPISREIGRLAREHLFAKCSQISPS